MSMGLCYRYWLIRRLQLYFETSLKMYPMYFLQIKFYIHIHNGSSHFHHLKKKKNTVMHCFNHLNFPVIYSPKIPFTSLLNTQQNSNKKFSLQMSTCVSYIAWTYSTVILLLANVYFYKYRIHKFTCTFLCDGLSG